MSLRPDARCPTTTVRFPHPAPHVSLHGDGTRGTWNSGFLTTEAGTIGRFIGDLAITLMGLMTLDWLDCLLFVPSVILVSFWHSIMLPAKATDSENGFRSGGSCHLRQRNYFSAYS